MKKIALFLMLPLVSFLATVVVLTVVTGNLSKEKLQSVLGKTDAKPAAVKQEQQPSESDVFARALKQRDEELKRREAKVREDEERVKKMQADLEQLRTELTTIQNQIQTALKSEDAKQKASLQDVALSLSKMKPTNAAETLSEWPPSEAADILRLIKDKERGKILDAMKPEKAAPLLKSLQEPRL